jgi:head-tail adaptor
VNAGPMRFRFTLQRRPATPARDSYNQRKATPDQWTSLGDQWGSLRQLSAREQVNADRLKVTATHVVELRWTQPLSESTDRLVVASPPSLAGKVFDVTSADDVDFRHREYRLLVEEVRNRP